MNQAPRGFSRRQVLIGLAFAAVSLGALYIVLPTSPAWATPGGGWIAASPDG